MLLSFVTSAASIFPLPTPASFSKCLKVILGDINTKYGCIYVICCQDQYRTRDTFSLVGVAAPTRYSTYLGSMPAAVGGGPNPRAAFSEVPVDTAHSKSLTSVGTHSAREKSFLKSHTPYCTASGGGNSRVDCFGFGGGVPCLRLARVGGARALWPSAHAGGLADVSLAQAPQPRAPRRLPMVAPLRSTWISVSGGFAPHMHIAILHAWAQLLGCARAMLVR